MRVDPGSCPICDAPHCSCGGPGLEVVQLPARDAAVVAASLGAAPLVADAVQAALPPGQFTSATYRGTKTKGKP